RRRAGRAPAARPRGAPAGRRPRRALPVLGRRRVRDRPARRGGRRRRLLPHRMIALDDSFAKVLGLRFDDAVRLTIRPELLNDHGLLLGPVVFSMVDYAMTRELLPPVADGARIATTHIALSFLASAREGDVKATATLDRQGRTTAFLSARVEHE